ncbi:hypothetical protein Lmor_0995 [Legionella moravica]|uniref:Transmembrane protein n=1 Tax=Legionella moravica TaxID=39962 RepID=A0A378JW90_9GAMM|nr:hypothetical protein [Legionella moravica]KTD35548.1 hypothetical protein Lmor_0995 [Legionella moravica]STX62696.1 Uncharacterised protein [Legionella moravica]
MKLSPSSEIILKPTKSKVYFRLISILYFLTVALIVYSSLFSLIKLALIAVLSVYMIPEFINKNPSNFIIEMIYRNKEWYITTKNGITEDCDELRIIIHNTLFQLIQISILDKRKLFILFNDQISEHQLRQLHHISSNE